MSALQKTRFVCRITRLRAALTGATESRHIETCGACQEFFRAADGLDQLLHRDTARETLRVPEGFERRVGLALRTSEQAPRTSRTRSATFAFAGAAAAAAVAIIIFYAGPDQDRDQPQLTAQSSRPADVDDLVTTVDALRTHFWNSVEPAAETLARENPLSQEIGLVQADARSALGFLALNFLPSATANPAAEPQHNLSPTRS